MQIEYVWIGLAVLLVLLELWAINNVLRSGIRWENKGLWLVLIIFMPLLGMILWVLIGKSASSPEPGKD
ncbi:PLD nuclease N-terminal domain-containing protein [Pseudomonas fluorescens]|uniref:PLD nuclease N-terminal domain-containing protein n=1 Tax=Pseudomonas fluorescens TaxID=294 RepID=UPI001BEA6A03|nr:PLD nuclease N-terminal domain-containing protein [Pseudomonas fluorescens]MBT2372533.1 PLDc_N domain-containing protein [Pseudomonas fluorescens]